jgi:hypothetical protein
MNGSARRYGYDDGALHATLLGYGFSPCIYSPFERSLRPDEKHAGGNVLYLLDVANAQSRVRTAAAARVHGKLI